MGEVRLFPLSELVLPPISGSRPAGGVSADAEGIPSIGGENILADGGMTYVELKKIPTAFFQLMPKGKLQRDDVLINKDGAQTGKVGLYRAPFENAAINEHVFILRARDRRALDQHYLYYCLLLSDTQIQIQRRITGSAQPGLNSQFVRAVKIPVPLPAQQEKITAILNSIDDAIERTEALIAKYRQIKAGLMRDLFTRGVLPNGQLRPPREQAPDLYRETAIGWIPKEWEVSTLRACLLGNPTNGIYKSADQIGIEGTLMIGQTAFTAERSVDFSLGRRGVVSPEETRQFGIAEGNILMTRVFATIEGVGLPSLVPAVSEPAVYESNMMRLHVDTRKVIPRLLFEWLRTPTARFHISARVNASNQCSVNQAAVNPLPVPIPDADEQGRLISRIESADGHFAQEVSYLAKLRAQKLGLMQDLLTGKVTVKTKESEPVEAAA